MKNENEMYLDPKPPGWRLLTNAEADKLLSRLHAITTRLKGADQGAVELSFTERSRLEAERDSLKKELHDAERRPTGPAATENEKAESLALNDPEAVERALSNASPAERREFRRSVEKLGRAVDELAGDLERAGLVGTATAANVGADDDELFAPVRPYWK